MKQRLLVHGPRLADPGDLLFFDAWLWPTLQAVGVRSRLPPGDGMAIGETWPQPLLDALGAAGRTLPLPELTTELVTTSMPDVAGWLASGADPATAFSPAVAAAVGGIIAETMVAPLPSPARDAELHTWTAPSERSNSSCSGLRTTLTSGTPSLMQSLTSIWPRFDAAAVCTRPE